NHYFIEGINVKKDILSKLGRYATIQVRKVREQKAAYPPYTEGLTLRTEERRAMRMVTYADLFQFCIFIVALVGLCYTVFKGGK
ncbi:hypothetical protein D3Z51_20185, partial [Clostridiaceae bacterium]